jgi:hypothetical protein
MCQVSKPRFDKLGQFDPNEAIAVVVQPAASQRPWRLMNILGDDKN